MALRPWRARSRDRAPATTPPWRARPGNLGAHALFTVALHPVPYRLPRPSGRAASTACAATGSRAAAGHARFAGVEIDQMKMNTAGFLAVSGRALSAVFYDRRTPEHRRPRLPESAAMNTAAGHLPVPLRPR
jgi:hypothetical protein